MQSVQVTIPAAGENRKEADHDKMEQSPIRDTAEVVSPAVLSEIRRDYRIMKRHGFLRDGHIRYWWTTGVSRLTKENANLQPGGFGNYGWLLNKCTFYYYTQHETDSFEKKARLHNDAILVYPGSTSASSILGAAVCKSWYEVHDEQPNIDWSRYFAYPFLVDKRSPTLVELVDMHRTICQQSVKRQQDAAETWRLGARGNWEGNDPRNFRSFPLCWALMVVQDNYIDCSNHPAIEHLHVHYDPEYLNIYRQIQTVVLVRTGDEQFMSSPINFSTIVDKSFPLDRPDLLPDSGIDAIRVSLHDAVKFISDLQQQEEKERPHVYHIKRKQNHAHTDLILRNPTGEERDGRYYPASEEDYMTEVLKVDKYICSRRLIDEAKEAVIRRAAGPRNESGWALNRYGSVPLWLDRS